MKSINPMLRLDVIDDNWDMEKETFENENNEIIQDRKGKIEVCTPKEDSTSTNSRNMLDVP